MTRRTKGACLLQTSSYPKQPAARVRTPIHSHRAPPAGLLFDSGTRTLSGTPTDATAQTTYTYMVTDASAASASLQFTIEVTAGVHFSITVDDQTYERAYLLQTSSYPKQPAARVRTPIRLRRLHLPASCLIRARVR